MDWNAIFTPIVNQILAAVIFALVGVAAGWFWRGAAWVESRLPQAWDWVLKDMAQVAVKASQQVFKGLSANNGAAYDAAAEYLTTEAARAGLAIDENTVRGLIEAAVFDLKQDLAANATPPAPPAG